MSASIERGTLLAVTGGGNSSSLLCKRDHKMTTAPRHTSTCLLCALLGAASAPLHAQQPPEPDPQREAPRYLSMTSRQIELNNLASMALNQTPPDSKVAIDYLQQAIASGEAPDILYMSLGRAYQYEDQCQSAQDVFNLAEKSPSLESIPHDVVVEKIARFRKEGASLCSGTVEIVCKEMAVKFYTQDVSGEPIQLVCGERKKLRPGAYDFEVVQTNVPDEDEGGVSAGEATTLSLGSLTGLIIGEQVTELFAEDFLAANMKRASDLDTTLTQPPRPLILQPATYDGFKIAGLTMLATGSVALIAGGVKSRGLYAQLERRELTYAEAQRGRWLRNGLYVGGGALAGVGAAFYVTSLLFERRARRRFEEEATPEVGASLDPKNPSITLIWEF